MNILVLGGTEFLGRHFVEIAHQRGHNLTLFNRGKTNPNIFPELETIIGDRTKDFDKLNGRRFDAVLDTCGYFPKNIEYVTSRLKSMTSQYVFVSSISVYDHRDKTTEIFDEQGPLSNLKIDINDTSPETYGARKFHCEEIVRNVFKDKHFIVRPGLIVGPHDPTYRFPYWADRMSEGGDILCPGKPDAPLQFIDVRDLSQWLLKGIEQRIMGTFNTVTPHADLTIGDFLDKTRAMINPECKFNWISEQFLRDNQITCWRQMPLWVYEEIQGIFKIDSSKAIAEGLCFRPLSESINDTHNWSKAIYGNLYLDKVLSRDQEADVLEKYRSSVR